jgi:hypothetical protein
MLVRSAVESGSAQSMTPSNFSELVFTLVWETLLCGTISFLKSGHNNSPTESESYKLSRKLSKEVPQPKLLHMSLCYSDKQNPREIPRGPWTKYCTSHRENPILTALCLSPNSFQDIFLILPKTWVIYTLSWWFTLTWNRYEA